MLLDAQQWFRLQANISYALPFFRQNGILKGGTLEKISDSTLHQVLQIRKPEDWDEFTKDIENPLPLGLVMNFANCLHPIPWPWSGNARRDALYLLSKGQPLNVRWIDLMGEKITLHNNPDIYGIVFMHTETEHRHDIGIMVSDRLYIPVTVNF